MSSPAPPSAARPPLLLAVALASALALAGLLAPSPPVRARTDAELAPLTEVPVYSPDALEALVEADQAARLASPIDHERLEVEDAARRQIVGAWLDAGRIRDGRGLWCAALVFQHGRELAHFARARDLARAAAEAGYPQARWLKAAAEDRWLLTQGEPQRYGTQLEQVEGTWQLAPVDPDVTDAERARWDVPPLATLRLRARAMNAPEAR